MSANIVIKQTSWHSDKQALTSIRRLVFIEEQKVPVDLEWDEKDTQAIHWLALNEMKQPIGCARLVNHHIGRMAVLKDWRGKGVGDALLKAAVTQCKIAGKQEVVLSAQTHAISFYEQQGFSVVSKPYLDANIWHVDMVLNI